MPSARTETVTFRLSPETEATLRQAAERERRSLADMPEVMIRDWSDAHEPIACARSGADRPEGLGPEQAD